jgi:DNA-directed RNA polymerase subunit RPC12/RpoP
MSEPVIPAEYIIEPVGRKNGMVYKCVECWKEAPDCNVTPYIIGFADTQWGRLVFWECPHCYQKQFFHYRSDGYNYLEAYKAYKNGDVKWLFKGLKCQNQ